MVQTAHLTAAPFTHKQKNKEAANQSQLKVDSESSHCIESNSFDSHLSTNNAPLFTKLDTNCLQQHNSIKIQFSVKSNGSLCYLIHLFGIYMAPDFSHSCAVILLNQIRQRFACGTFTCYYFKPLMHHGHIQFFKIQTNY